MNDNKFPNSLFFDTSLFAYRDILESCTPWQSVASLTGFLAQIFAKGRLIPNFRGKPDIFVGTGTTIHDSVEIKGPAIIGRDCEIRHAAFLREGCIIGDNTIIGHAVEVKHSIILNNSILAHLNYIGDSIIGNNVNISGGVVVANFRLDKQNIVIKSQEGNVDTRLPKFGAVVGDNSQIGVNSVLNPGTLLGKNTAVYPLKSITGVHLDNAILK